MPLPVEFWGLSFHGKNTLCWEVSFKRARLLALEPRRFALAELQKEGHPLARPQHLSDGEKVDRQHRTREMAACDVLAFRRRPSTLCSKIHLQVASFRTDRGSLGTRRDGNPPEVEAVRSPVDLCSNCDLENHQGAVCRPPCQSSTCRKPHAALPMTTERLLPFGGLGVPGGVLTGWRLRAPPPRLGSSRRGWWCISWLRRCGCVLDEGAAFLPRLQPTPLACITKAAAQQADGSSAKTREAAEASGGPGGLACVVVG